LDRLVLVGRVHGQFNPRPIDEAALEETEKTEREGKRLAKVLNGAVKIAGQEAVKEFEVTLQKAKEEEEAEKMGLEEKDFKQELGITEGKCASP
jgi:uncharacterized sporulation protein YeaH/YhbH (DUF444 family)